MYASLRMLVMLPSWVPIWLTLEWMLSSAASPGALPISSVASKKAALARSVRSRGWVTL